MLGFSFLPELLTFLHSGDIDSGHSGRGPPRRDHLHLHGCRRHLQVHPAALPPGSANHVPLPQPGLPRRPQHRCELQSAPFPLLPLLKRVSWFWCLVLSGPPPQLLCCVWHRGLRHTHTHTRGTAHTHTSNTHLKVKVNIALFLPDSQGGLWLSLDFGAKWTKVHDGVHSFSWWGPTGSKTTFQNP